MRPFISLMSAPAAKAFSLPVRTMAPTAGSASKPRSAAPTSVISASQSAFSAAGRSSVTSPTLPRVSARIIPYPAIGEPSLSAAAGCGGARARSTGRGARRPIGVPPSRAYRGRMSETKPRVALFVTCLVDLYRPSVGFAAIRLLEEAGCTVTVPAAQTCCGQPAYNAGDRATAKDLARPVIDAFLGHDHVVVPSGSCAGMIAHGYPALFDDDPAYRGRAEALAARTHELTAFLVDVTGLDAPRPAYDGVAAYHDSCAGLREMGVRAQPRRLLARVPGLTVKELAEPELCCGFGGTFCVKYPAISTRMVTDKAADIRATGADTLLAGDMGCLLNMAGRLSREGSPVRVRHVAEVLAGMTGEVPPIGEPGGGPDRA